MSTYTIYLGTNPVATVKGALAYEVYAKTRDLVKLIGGKASLVWDETGEEVACFDSNGKWLED